MIAETIRISDFTALLFSSASVARDGFYQREIRICLDVLQEKASSKVWLLPIRLDECQVPAEIADIQYVDFFPYWDAGMERLLRAIAEQTEIKHEVEKQLTDIILETTDEQPEDADLHKQVIRLLEQAGAHQTRLGSGSHQIWEIHTKLANGFVSRRFVVPRVTSVVAANQIMRQVGLETIF